MVVNTQVETLLDMNEMRFESSVLSLEGVEDGTIWQVGIEKWKSRTNFLVNFDYGAKEKLSRNPNPMLTQIFALNHGSQTHGPRTACGLSDVHMPPSFISKKSSYVCNFKYLLRALRHNLKLIALLVKGKCYNTYESRPLLCYSINCCRRSLFTSLQSLAYEVFFFCSKLPCRQ
jgi:hypothetical protein